MALDDISRQQAAEALATAERQRAPIAPLSETYPAIDVASAYAIQLLQIQAKLGRGEVVRGHKVGLSSRAMQKMIGVDEPDYGHLLSSMFVAEVLSENRNMVTVFREAGYQVSRSFDGGVLRLEFAIDPTEALLAAR